ncbi:universal stress protein [Deferribacter desulfuricans SSM1]|uniref:Universal stress protein n=1 Tax=Deferribacter desulfuricans (strain DSM 14783 / JCM 11476 / NBRC 101012 / SSM1) TaxID=639282 RepID=D3P953_DEFDS|nr:universal stress protein [Deferribacter desulfuricans]BAI81243.1 universal stress protein [Deferribacter desulfuricans SSM1]
MIEIKKILCPVDFSETSNYALTYAIDFAKVFNAELELFHVIFDESQIVAFYLPQVTFQNFDKELEEAAKKEMDKLVEDFEELKNVNYSVKFAKGTPFLEIINEAKENSFDMIVIGTHGRTGLEHALFGSTAEKVVRKAPCPVFTVRLKGHKFKMP